MKKDNIKRVKFLLFWEYLIVILNIIIILILTYISETLTNKIENIIIIFSIIIIIFTAFISILIEQRAGYYECSICLNRYKPKYLSVFFAFHINRTRYMRCPKCMKKSWQKKVLTKN